MEVVLLGLVAIGLCIGSFCNVIITRSVAALNNSDQLPHTFGGRSLCPSCQKQLRWWELVPILSFLFLRGRCQRCRTKISWQYPIVEFVMGALVLLLVQPMPNSMIEAATIVAEIMIAALLMILFVIDLKTMFLPDQFVLMLLAAVLFHQFVSSQLSVVSSLLGLAIGAGFLLFLWLITRGRGIGLGDVKLMVPLGILFGPLGTTALLFIVYTIGGLLAIYLLARKKAGLKTALPFGPFLCGAALTLLVFPNVPSYLITLLFGYNPFG